jgi:hypothetical protein
MTFTLDDTGTYTVARQLRGSEEPRRPAANHQHIWLREVPHEHLLERTGSPAATPGADSLRFPVSS